MNKLIIFSSSITLFCLSVSTYATVGGPQHIEVLGLDQKDLKIYFLRHFEDEQGRLPQLYYYQLNKPQSKRLITVKSLYINPKTKQIDYHQDSTQFDREILQIRQRLSKLPLVHNSNVSIKLITSFNGLAKTWYDPNETIDKWTYQYQVKSVLYHSNIQTAVSYKSGLNISKTYEIPNQPYLLVIVQYLGIPFEMGYNIEDPVLLGK